MPDPVMEAKAFVQKALELPGSPEEQTALRWLQEMGFEQPFELLHESPTTPRGPCIVLGDLHMYSQGVDPDLARMPLSESELGENEGG